jgi:hypothetical protein
MQQALSNLAAQLEWEPTEMVQSRILMRYGVNY